MEKPEEAVALTTEEALTFTRLSGTFQRDIRKAKSNERMAEALERVIIQFDANVARRYIDLEQQMREEQKEANPTGLSEYGEFLMGWHTKLQGQLFAAARRWRKTRSGSREGELSAEVVAQHLAIFTCRDRIDVWVNPEIAKSKGLGFEGYPKEEIKVELTEGERMCVDRFSGPFLEKVRSARSDEALLALPKALDNPEDVEVAQTLIEFERAVRKMQKDAQPKNLAEYKAFVLKCKANFSKELGKAVEEAERDKMRPTIESVVAAVTLALILCNKRFKNPQLILQKPLSLPGGGSTDRITVVEGEGGEAAGAGAEPPEKKRSAIAWWVAQVPKASAEAGTADDFDNKFIEAALGQIGGKLSSDAIHAINSEGHTVVAFPLEMTLPEYTMAKLDMCKRAVPLVPPSIAERKGWLSGIPKHVIDPAVDFLRSEDFLPNVKRPFRIEAADESFVKAAANDGVTEEMLEEVMTTGRSEALEELVRADIDAKLAAMAAAPTPTP